MPTIANVSVIGHAYGPPKFGETNGKPWCQLGFYTVDKVKGETDKKFTAWSGFVNGPQAEWLRDLQKGDLIIVTGTIRATVTERDGKPHARIEFTRIHDARKVESDHPKTLHATASASKPIAMKPAPNLSPKPDEDSELPF